MINHDRNPESQPPSDIQTRSNENFPTRPRHTFSLAQGVGAIALCGLAVTGPSAVQWVANYPSVTSAWKEIEESNAPSTQALKKFSQVIRTADLQRKDYFSDSRAIALGKGLIDPSVNKVLTSSSSSLERWRVINNAITCSECLEIPLSSLLTSEDVKLLIRPQTLQLLERPSYVAIKEFLENVDLTARYLGVENSDLLSEVDRSTALVKVATSLREAIRERVCSDLYKDDESIEIFLGPLRWVEENLRIPKESAFSKEEVLAWRRGYEAEQAIAAQRWAREQARRTLARSPVNHNGTRISFDGFSSGIDPVSFIDKPKKHLSEFYDEARIQIRFLKEQFTNPMDVAHLVTLQEKLDRAMEDPTLNDGQRNSNVHRAIDELDKFAKSLFRVRKGRGEDIDQ